VDPDEAWATAVRYLPFVRACAARHASPGVERADLVQAGAIGFYRAMRTFDPARGVDPATYARGAIRRRIRAEIMAWRPVPATDATLAAIPDRDVEHVEHVELRQALASLPDRDRELIRLRYEGGRTQAEAGAAVGLTRGGARKAEEKALRALRAILDPGPDGEPIPAAGRRPRPAIAPDADLSVLTPRERDMVRLRLVERRPLAELAATYGLSMSRVSRIVRAATRKLGR
jgi:RNA polymerase sigma factor (sigma-70 family)